MTISSSANAGMAWVDNFLAEAKAADAAKQKFKWPTEPSAGASAQQWQNYHTEFQRVMTESQNAIQDQIKNGKAIDPFAPATKHHNIPDTIDGVETGFLNSRYLTLDYLSRAEDLIENHPDVAAKIFDQGDSMHRTILTLIKYNDFEPGMDKYADAIDKQYTTEGDKVAMSGVMGGLGDAYGMHATSPEVTQFLMGNNYVNMMEKNVDDVISQQEKVAQLKSSHEHALRMANNATYLKASGTGSSEASAEFANAWQNEEALLRGRLSSAEQELRNTLQDIKNLESRGIAGDVTANLFEALYEKSSGDKAKLDDLYEQYQVTVAQPYVDHGANSGFMRLMRQIEHGADPAASVKSLNEIPG